MSISMLRTQSGRLLPSLAPTVFLSYLYPKVLCLLLVGQPLLSVLQVLYQMPLVFLFSPSGKEFSSDSILQACLSPLPHACPWELTVGVPVDLRSGRDLKLPGVTRLMVNTQEPVNVCSYLLPFRKIILGNICPFVQGSMQKLAHIAHKSDLTAKSLFFIFHVCLNL